jgi:hypothetical protein
MLIRRSRKITLELKLNGSHQLLEYTDDVNLLGYNVDTIKKTTETLIDANKEVSLEINIHSFIHTLFHRTFLPK